MWPPPPFRRQTSSSSQEPEKIGLAQETGVFGNYRPWAHLPDEHGAVGGPGRHVPLVRGHGCAAPRVAHLEARGPQLLLDLEVADVYHLQQVVLAAGQDGPCGIKKGSPFPVLREGKAWIERGGT